jgi:GTP-binding protein HflX
VERVLLVHVECGKDRTDTATRAERIEEARLLVASAGAAVIDAWSVQRDKPDPATFLGAGKVEALASAVKAQGMDLVVINQPISAVHARNLERAVGVRVIDRTELILDIFGQRARTHEGKLQVELARLQHQATRLIRGWTHLERQKGGIGLRGGMGESQLEIDRRLLAGRVREMRTRLAKVARQRATQRARRVQSGVFRVAIVGYTNAGKSTLFNRLSGANTVAADQLFATLDTTTRRTYVGEGAPLALSDTVGFIRDLPHSLVDAFKATLEETIDADLLLHVVDAASSAREDQVLRVNEVLAEIGAGDLPQLMVLNKIDRAEPSEPGVQRGGDGNILAVRVSALSGAGLADLRDVLRSLATRKVPVPTAQAEGSMSPTRLAA